MAFRRELLFSVSSILKTRSAVYLQIPLLKVSSWSINKDKLLRSHPLHPGSQPFLSFRQFSKSAQIQKSLPLSNYQDGDQKATINTINVLEDERSIEITWNGSSASGLFPFVWLRDHCQCEQCFHPITHSRTMQFGDLKLDESPLYIKIENETILKVEWSDGHTSHYDSDWLQKRRFERSVSINKRPSAYKLPRIFWGSEIAHNPPTVDFRDVITDDYALLSWLQQLEVFGFVLIKNAPIEHGQVKRLADRVAFIRKTHYGAEFSVKVKPNPSNVAYSSGPLQLHTDLPYYEYKPGAQMIHCLIQFEGKGAESQIADAAHVANELKRIAPEKFQILSETLVDWCDVGKDEGREFFKILQCPVICTDSNGEITRINVSHPQRDSFFNVNHETVFKWYDALKTFHDMLYDPQYCLEFKMAPGMIQSFDNLRIVHGRKEYEEGTGEREIAGCYIDWDEIRSRRRVLEKRLNVSSEFWHEHRHLTQSH